MWRAVYTMKGSFNPCSAGSWVGTRKVRLTMLSVYRFQSLFCWILGWNTSRLSGLRPSRLVSILVLLDLGLERKSHRIVLMWAISFNPCSAGSWVGTTQSSLLPASPVLVSILVLLDLGLEHVKKHIGSLDALAFQSLFCWILGWNTILFFLEYSLFLCFNPCSAGSWVGT